MPLFKARSDSREAFPSNSHHSSSARRSNQPSSNGFDHKNIFEAGIFSKSIASSSDSKNNNSRKYNNGSNSGGAKNYDGSSNDAQGTSSSFNLDLTNSPQMDKSSVKVNMGNLNRAKQEHKGNKKKQHAKGSV